MFETIASRILEQVVIITTRYCDSGIYNGKHFVELKGYITSEQLDYLLNLPPIKREPEIKINYPDKTIE